MTLVHLDRLVLPEFVVCLGDLVPRENLVPPESEVLKELTVNPEIRDPRDCRVYLGPWVCLATKV